MLAAESDCTKQEDEQFGVRELSMFNKFFYSMFNRKLIDVLCTISVSLSILASFSLSLPHYLCLHTTTTRQQPILESVLGPVSKATCMRKAASKSPIVAFIYILVVRC